MLTIYEYLNHKIGTQSFSRIQLLVFKGGLNVSTEDTGDIYILTEGF